MAYEKQIWLSGDVLSSAKLNHMEEGIEAGNVPAPQGPLFVPVVPSRVMNGFITQVKFQKSNLEIKTALDKGRPVLAVGSFDEALSSMPFRTPWPTDSIVSCEDNGRGNMVFTLAGGYPYTIDSGSLSEDHYPHANYMDHLYCSSLSGSNVQLWYQHATSEAQQNLQPSNTYMWYIVQKKALPVDLFIGDGSVCKCVGVYINSASSTKYVESIVYRYIGPYSSGAVARDLRFTADRYYGTYTLQSDTTT